MTELDKIIEEYIKLNPSKKSKKPKNLSELEKQNRQSSRNIGKLLKSLSDSKCTKSSRIRKNIKSSNYPSPTFNQRVIIKATYKIITNRAEARRSLKSHMNYIMREGTGDSPPFSPDQKYMDSENVQNFPKGDNEKIFRFIISPENAKMFRDDAEFKNYIQDVMTQLSHDLQIPQLNWLAVNHYNTTNPHCHVLLKGLSKEGKDVTIPKEYLKSNFRKMSEEIATNYLGARSIKDLQAAKYAEVDAERFTSIDAKIIASLKNNIFISLPSSEVCTNLEKEETRLITLRLHALTRLGLAKQFDKSSYAVHPDLKEKLQAMPLEKDIIKKLAHLSQKHSIDKNTHYNPNAETPPITGTVIDKGYFDEATESKYIILLDINRMTHYVKLSRLSEISGNESNIGDLIKISSKSSMPNESISVMVDKISTMTLNDQIDYSGITYLDRIIANKSYIFENPNNYQKELSESVKKRIQHLTSQGKLFDIQNEFKFKKGYWDDGEVSEHGRVKSDFQQVHKILQEGETFTGKMIDTKVFQNGTHAIISNGKEFVVIPLKPKMIDHLQSGKRLEVTKIKARRGYSNPLYSFKLASLKIQDITTSPELTSKPVDLVQPVMPKATKAIPAVDDEPPAQPKQEAAAKLAGQQHPSAFREGNDPLQQPAVEFESESITGTSKIKVRCKTKGMER